MGRRENWSVSLAILLWSCGASSELPEVKLDGVSGAVRPRFEKALEEARTNPEDAEASGELGMLLHAYQNLETAAAYYRQAHSLDPESPRWAYYLGVVSGGEIAVESFRETLRLEPGYVPASLGLAELLLNSGQVGESRKIYESVLARGPNAAAHYGLGQLEAQERNVTSAVDHLRKACELAPNYRAAHYALARAYQGLGKKAEAEKHLFLYRQSEADRRAYSDPWMDEVDVLRIGSPQHHLRTGLRHDEAGRDSEALAEYLEALRVDPDFVQAHVNLISVYGRQKQYERAEHHYGQAMRLDPNREECHYNFGVLRSEQGRHSEAAEAYKQALRLNPGSAEAHNNLGYSLQHLGRDEEALEHFHAAIRSKPNYRLAHVHLARHHYAKANYDDAIRHLELALKPDDEQTPRFRFLLARACAKAGRAEEALAHARTARGQAAQLGQQDLVELVDREFR